MSARIAVAAAIVISGAVWTDGEGIRQSSRMDYVDVHMHLAGADFDAAAASLVAMMDRFNVAKSVVMPPPQEPDQPQGYTYQRLLATIRKYPGRLVLASGGGELNPILVKTDPAKVTAGIRSDFERKAEEIARNGARAFGEMVALHFSFRDTHPFEQIAADHPLYLLLADIAARRDMAIDLHLEAVIQDQPVPPRLAKVSPRNPAVIRSTIPAFERLLAHNRGARVVWQHVGWDNTGQMTPNLLQRLLEAHPNLFLAIKVVRPQRELFRSGNNIVDAERRILPDWLGLITRYPDRFVMGADEFVGSGRGFTAGPPSFEDTWFLVDQLPADLRVKVGRENAMRIYGLR